MEKWIIFMNRHKTTTGDIFNNHYFDDWLITKSRTELYVSNHFTIITPLMCKQTLISSIKLISISIPAHLIIFMIANPSDQILKVFV